jgi:carbon monoxide dehydrogenase subunit G
VPSETFTHTALTPASPGDVWEALDEPKTWAAIGGVDRVFDPNIDGEGRLRGFSFETVAGGMRYVGIAVPHERLEGELMAWKVRNSEVHGVTTVSLSPAEGGTEITVALEVNSAGLLSTMVFPLIARAIGSGLPQAVNEFAADLGS